ncbi:MAG: sensor histidine kinase [Lachnospiraceae bacterium]|jgi:two-component system sensor histidine kinase YesM|nr:sensor histidine kinase [Lachnospiraceae bacterium]
MRKKDKKYRYTKVSISVLLTGVVTIIVTIAGISAVLIFIQLYQNSTEENAVTSGEQAVVQVQNTVRNYLDDMKNIMRMIGKNMKTSKQEQQMFFRDLVKIRGDLVSILIYDENYRLVNSWAERYELKSRFDMSVPIEDMTDLDGKMMISKPHVETGLLNYYPWVVTIYQRLKNEAGEDVYVFMNISFDSIASYIDDVGIGQHGYCFLMEQEGNIIYHPQQQLIFSGLKEMREDDMRELAKSMDGSVVKEDIIYNTRTLKDYGWKIVGVSYIDEMITSKVEKMKRTSYVLIYLVLLTAVVMGFFFTRIFSKPVNRLIEAMRKFEGNAETFNFESVGTTKEIAELSDSFAHMVIRLQQLMEQVREEEVTLRKTELNALQSQINPHFLYNTLDSIAWMCEAERTSEAIEMVNTLARLFRISISRGHELIPLEKELQHAECYLKIQSFRYKNQFVYVLDADQECLGYYCNKITLQPLIENAIYHGLNRMIDQGEIYIGIHQKDEDIILEVRDNGVGMDKKMCREILHKECGNNGGIGIKNVNDRIKIYFGSQYGLTIHSELDEGTSVIIEIPKIRREEYETE